MDLTISHLVENSSVSGVRTLRQANPAGGAAFIPSSTEVGGAGKATSGDLVHDITRKGNVSPGLPGSTEPGETALA
ncbi:hypothetical protein ADUPG1_005836, partial [Aduncisulcus paluster]